MIWSFDLFIIILYTWWCYDCMGFWEKNKWFWKLKSDHIFIDLLAIDYNNPLLNSDLLNWLIE